MKVTIIAGGFLVINWSVNCQPEDYLSITLNDTNILKVSNENSGVQSIECSEGDVVLIEYYECGSDMCDGEAMISFTN